MAGSSELTEFRRAFVWLLCGMLLPSVALVAFGVVAVANERAAVERRLTDEYDGRLAALQRDLTVRLDQAAEAVAAQPPRPEPPDATPAVGPVPPDHARPPRAAPPPRARPSPTARSRSTPSATSSRPAAATSR